MRKFILSGVIAMSAMFSIAQTPTVNAKKTTATITIDGNPSEAAWEVINNCSKVIIGTPNNTVKWGVLWNNQYLYIAFNVTDGSKYNDSPNDWDDDACEVYIDADNNGGTSYGTNDRQYIKGWNTTTIWEKQNRVTGVLHAWTNTATGYSVEIAIPWSNINTTPVVGLTIGFDVASDDDDNGGARESQLMWAGDNDNWQYPRNFGDLVLIDVAPDTTAPSAPANLAVSNLAATSLTLNWSASTDNVGVTGYDIYQDNVKINTSPVTTTTYNVTGLTTVTTYSFYVRARDAAGNISANSNTVNATTTDNQPPTAPTNLAASNITANSLTLDWTASTDNVGVTGYDIYQNNVKINASPVTVTTYDVSGLSVGVSYSFYVRARDAANNTSSNSNTVNVTIPDTEAPTDPTNLSVSNLAATTLTLDWTASTDNVTVTGYDVYQDDVKINASPVITTSYNVTGLTTVTNYNFYVRARDAAGNISGNSNTVNVTTTDNQPPAAPENLAASNITTNSLTLDWDPSSDNVGVTGYDIYQNNVKINASPVTVTTYDVSGLNQAVAYSFYVRARDAANNISGNSNTVNVTIPDSQSPTAPANLAVSNLASTSLTLTWSAATDNVGVTGYDVYQNNVKINPSNVTATSYNVTGLTPSTAYSFFVRAKDAAGNVSANSNTVNATTPAASTCTGTGAINFQKFLNITGTSISNLTSSPNYPNSPNSSGTLTTFEMPSNTADNYGMRVYGYICPPTTGSYTFWIAADDNCELWLSTTTSPANKVKIAYHTQWTASREWNKYTTQKSAAITLTAGQLYYVGAAGACESGICATSCDPGITSLGTVVACPGFAQPTAILSPCDPSFINAST